MPGKSRFLSEEQAITISTYRQDSFAGGLNTDRPASELSEGELAGADNVQCFPKDVTGRPGTTLFKNRKMPGSGTLHDIAFHQSSKKWLLHQGSQLWKADSTMGTVWEELLLIGPDTSFAIDLDSNITENRENFIINTTSGIFHVLIADDTTPSIVFQANSPSPSIPLLGYTILGHLHTYRIVYTYVRLTGNTADGRFAPGAVLEQETGSVNIAANDEKDYAVFSLIEPFDENNNIKLNFKNPLTITPSIDLGVMTFPPNTGGAFQLTTTATLPPPLLTNTTYYAIRNSNTTIKFATTRANALAGVFIDITAGGGGDHFIEPQVYNNIGAHHTHLGIYITGDLGSGIIDPETNTGFNPEIYTLIADIDITSRPDVVEVGISEDALKARIASGGFNLKTRQWAALPSGDLGEVAGGWFFSATTGEPTINYSQINDAGNKGASIGYYNPALQVNKLQDGVRAFVDTGDYVIVCTSNKTYMYRINSFNNVGVLESVFQLTTPARIDDTIGVIDVGTIAQISEGRFIAVCSDASVRIFDTVRWGSDLSLDKVKTSEIKKMQNGSVAAYFQGAYYLWYRKDSTDTHNTNTLRLAVEDAAGEGWTTYSGTNWIKPPLNNGAINFVDDNDLSRIVVVDFTSLRPYWIETFNGYTGSGLVRTFIDKSDDPGICPLGSTYLFDALDNNSFDTGSLSEDLTGTATTVESQHLCFVDSVHASANEARIISDDSIGAGDEWDVSISVTDYVLSSTSNGVSIAWDELKLGPFASPGDDIEIGTLAGDGVYFYVKVFQVSAGVYTYSLHWEANQGGTNYTSTQAIGSLSEAIRITLVGTTLTWYYGGVQIDTDTDAAWASFPVLKGSFAASDEGTGTETRAGCMNYFSIVSDSGMDGTCIGTDGYGSDTVTGRSPSGTIKTKEVIGNREANTKEVQEAHAYLRPSEEANGFPATFEVDAKDYVNGSVTAHETVNDVRYLGDIQFFKEASGRRLQAEFITNSTDFRMTSLDVDFIEKREKAEPLTTSVVGATTYTDTEVFTDQETYHNDYSTRSSTIDLLFNVSRYDYTMELSQNVRADSFKLIKLDETDPEGGYTRTTGPDGKMGSAIAYLSPSVNGTVNIITYDSPKLEIAEFRNHLWSFWVKNPEFADKAIEYTTGGVEQQSYIQFDNSTTLNYSGLGTVTIDDVTVNGWHNIWIRRYKGDVFVYQNKVLKGSFSITASLDFDGVDFKVQFDLAKDTEWFDISLKMLTKQKGFSPDDIDVFNLETMIDYYDDVINNEGRNYLP